MGVSYGYFLLTICCIVLYSSIVKGRMCYTCDNQPSFGQCAAVGQVTECQPNEDSCHTEVLRFKRPEGIVYQISKRCKQEAACATNEGQNPKAAWMPSQCNPRFPSSVCRCCCKGDYCNSAGLYCQLGPQCNGIPSIGANGYTKCNLGRNRYSRCVHECFEGFKLVGVKSTICKQKGTTMKWTNKQAPRCIRTSCLSELSDIQNGKKVCSDGNQLGSKCEFSCDEGYILQAGWPIVSCYASKPYGIPKWDGDIPTCEKFTCKPIVIANGVIECTKYQDIGSVCKVSCSTIKGFYRIGRKTAKCVVKNQILPPVWNTDIGTCRRIKCEPERRAPKNGLVDCSDENNYKSKCRFECDDGYYLVGKQINTCSHRGNNGYGRWDHSPPLCRDAQCYPPLKALVNGQTKCSDGRSHESLCTFTCDLGYELHGDNQTKCTNVKKQGITASWSNEVPTCEPLSCPEPRRLTNRRVTCSDGFNVGSVCQFHCAEGFVLRGKSPVKCVGVENYADWESKIPYCGAQDCPEVEAPANGNMKCSRGNKYNSKCEFECDYNHALYPWFNTNIRCMKNSTWTNPPPCCFARCPPISKIDMVIIMDSSSSIQARNWVKNINFIKHLISTFSMGIDSTRFGIFRYNNFIDSQTEVHLNDFTETADLHKALDNIPYNGEGTHTALALKHATDISFRSSNGNRPDAEDIIFLLTDGISTPGDIKPPIEKLRKNKIKVIALFTEPNNSYFTDRAIKELTTITGDAGNVIKTTSSASLDALSEVNLRLVEVMCERACKNHTYTYREGEQ